MAGTVGLAVLAVRDAPAERATPIVVAVDEDARRFHVEARTACPGARRAIGFYRAAFARHRATMRMPGIPRLVRYDCDATTRRATEWRERAAVERERARAWVAYHFHWWEWLPENWQRLGACETGYGRRPGNWLHANARFVSAFGISRSVYDRDARHAGAPPWNDRLPPTPRQQYMAALGHYDLFGDGWTCPGP